MSLHVAVIGTPLDKGSDNKYLDMPAENAAFIAEVLAKGNGHYGTIYHGAANGVDTVADDWAFKSNVRTKQFPAYWFDPTAEGKVNKSAGLTRTEHMLRALQSDVTEYDREAKVRKAKADTEGVVLIFLTKPVDDDRITKHAKEKCEKYGLSYRLIDLPVQSTTATEAPATSNAVPW